MLEMQSNSNNIDAGQVDLEEAEDMLRKTPQVILDDTGSVVSSLVSESASEDAQKMTVGTKPSEAWGAKPSEVSMGAKPSEAWGAKPSEVSVGAKPSEAWGAKPTEVHAVIGEAVLDTGLLASQLQMLADEQRAAHSQSYFHASAGRSGSIPGMHDVSSSVLTLSSRLSSDPQATCSQTSSHCSGAFSQTDPQGESVKLESQWNWGDWESQSATAKSANHHWDTLEEGASDMMAPNHWANWHAVKGSTAEVWSNPGIAVRHHRPPLLPGTPVRVQRYLEQTAADVKQKYADDWTSHVDPEGFMYYYSAKLDRSQWERPVGFVEDGEPEPVAEDPDLIYAWSQKEARRIAICSLLAVLIAGTAISCTYIIIATA